MYQRRRRLVPSLRRWTPLLAFAFVSCASARVRGTVPPHTLSAAIALDSARSLVRVALERESLPIDGAAGASEFSSAFVVRRGGMGEAQITVRLRLEPDPDATGSTTGGTLLWIDGTAQDRTRMLFMSPEDARSPRFGRQPHPIQDNDRESLQRIARLLERLQGLGWNRAPRDDRSSRN